MFTSKVSARTAVAKNYLSNKNEQTPDVKIATKNNYDSTSFKSLEKIAESPVRKFMKKFFDFAPSIDFERKIENLLRTNQKNFLPLNLGGKAKGAVNSGVSTRTLFSGYTEQKKSAVHVTLVTPKFVANLKRFKKTRELGRRLSNCN